MRALDRKARSHQRILDAAVALFTRQGVRATTMGQVAQRAGVQRVTVYRHFGDDAGLLRAVEAYCMRLYGVPDASALVQIADPIARARAALDTLYTHWGRMGPVIRTFLRDADLPPNRALRRPEQLYLDAHRVAVLEGFPARARSRRLRDAVRHSLDIRTWDTLQRAGLTRRRAVELMVTLLVAASGGRAGTLQPHLPRPTRRRISSSSPPS